MLRSVFTDQPPTDSQGDATWLLAEDDTTVFLGEVDARPVGVLIVNTAGPLILHGLGIVPPERRNGYAFQLLQEVLSRLSGAYPGHAVWTAIDPDHPNASGLFLRYGFKEIDGTVQGMRLMVLKLPVDPGADTRPQA